MTLRRCANMFIITITITIIIIIIIIVIAKLSFGNARAQN